MKDRIDIDRAFRTLAQQPSSVSMDEVRRLVRSGRKPRRSWTGVWLARVFWR